MATSYWEFCAQTVEEAAPLAMELVAMLRPNLEAVDALHASNLTPSKDLIAPVQRLEQMLREPDIAYEDGQRLTDGFVRACLRGIYGEDRQPTWETAFALDRKRTGADA